jgi:hypothetical protein
MPDLKITIRGLNEALEGIGKLRADMVADAAKSAALATIAVAKPYPAASRARQPFRSAASRRFFFAALRSGAITVPYRRTGALQDAWDWTPTADGADVVNAHPHADATITKAKRFKYHNGTWPTEDEIAERAANPARDAAEMAIIRLIAQADY